MEKLPPSPWAVISLTDFLNYNCPVCDFKSKEESKFLDHAYETHVESLKHAKAHLNLADFLRHERAPHANDHGSWQ